MLIFVTTVRHPANARSYQRVGKLLDRTLHSVRRQTDPELAVVIVHNEPIPGNPTGDSRVHYVPVDFPAPGSGQASRLGYAEVIFDKGTKSVVGSVAARRLGASHVAFIDADDLVHHGLASFVRQHGGAPGWYSPTGYVHTVGRRTVQWIEDDFNLKNGSTNIVRVDLLGLPDDLGEGASQEEIVAVLGPRRVSQVFGQHERWREAVSEKGEELDPLPFPSAIWMIGTGENHSGNLVSGRPESPIDTEITATFGLRRPSLAAATASRLVLTARRVVGRVSRVNRSR